VETKLGTFIFLCPKNQPLPEKVSAHAAIAADKLASYPVSGSLGTTFALWQVNLNRAYSNLSLPEI